MSAVIRRPRRNCAYAAECACGCGVLMLPGCERLDGRDHSTGARVVYATLECFIEHMRALNAASKEPRS